MIAISMRIRRVVTSVKGGGDRRRVAIVWIERHLVVCGVGVVARRRGRRPCCCVGAAVWGGAPRGLSRRSGRLHLVALSLVLLRGLQLIPYLLLAGRRSWKRAGFKAVPRHAHGASTHAAPQIIALERVFPRLLELLLEADGDEPVRERRAEGVAAAPAAALDEGRRAEALEARPRGDQGLAGPLGGGVQVLGKSRMNKERNRKEERIKKKNEGKIKNENEGRKKGKEKKGGKEK